MATLDRITVSGFKSIGSAELELRKLNVVIGPNGAGKSNLIGVFRLLDNILQRRLQEFVAQQGGANRMLHFGQKKSPSLSVRFDFGVNAYSFVLAANTSDGLFFQRERTHSSGSETPDGGSSLGSGQLEANLPDAPAKGDKVARYVLNGVTRWVVYHFHDTSDSSPPKQTQNVDDNRWLRPDGGNLAAYLLRLQHREQVAFRRITEYVQRVAPFFAEFLLAPRATQPDKIKLEWRQRGSDAYFDGASLSDGTLRFICLATLLLQPSYLMPSVVLIDEPELGLHPSALTLLVEMMRDATSHRQIVAATQSVTLLDHLMPEDVIVAEQDDQGSHFRRLDEPALRAWLDEYALGELWLKNVLGGRPG